MRVELLGVSHVACLHKELLVLKSDFYEIKNFRQGRRGNGNECFFEYQQPDPG